MWIRIWTDSMGKIKVLLENLGVRIVKNSIRLNWVFLDVFTPQFWSLIHANQWIIQYKSEIFKLH